MGKNKYNKYNVLVINRLSQKYGFTGYYIRQCLRGDRKNLTADQLRKEYNNLSKAITKLLEES
ncbi:hypothetical protein E6C50_04745 [Flavobacterium supellecticarium]|uniref:Uncharacterized protein n=1 Tax=Flavobacterium supellecticarium TaxID=2565924 RepID=A0A4S3ZYT4_9FLAO|nr:hypothetical protein E6C50_04745 [Flavobacterium supellecticarium]